MTIRWISDVYAPAGCGDRRCQRGVGGELGEIVDLCVAGQRSECATQREPLGRLEPLRRRRPARSRRGGDDRARERDVDLRGRLAEGTDANAARPAGTHGGENRRHPVGLARLEQADTVAARTKHQVAPREHAEPSDRVAQRSLEVVRGRGAVGCDETGRRRRIRGGASRDGIGSRIRTQERSLEHDRAIPRLRDECGECVG